MRLVYRQLLYIIKNGTYYNGTDVNDGTNGTNVIFTENLCLL